MNISKKRLRLPRVYFSISRKLILSYLALAAIIATAGGSGWVAVNSIGENVKVLAEVSAPIQEEASAVTRNVERSQNTALEVLTHSEATEIADNMEQANNAVLATSDGVQQTAEATEEITSGAAETQSASHALSTLAKQLSKTVEQFKEGTCLGTASREDMKRIRSRQRELTRPLRGTCLIVGRLRVRNRLLIDARETLDVNRPERFRVGDANAEQRSCKNCKALNLSSNGGLPHRHALVLICCPATRPPCARIHCEAG